jgi:hypothetical protein
MFPKNTGSTNATFISVFLVGSGSEGLTRTLKKVSPETLSDVDGG